MTNGSARHGIRPELIKRIIIYGLMVLLGACAQCSVLAQIDILPATPDIMLGIILAVALLDSVRSACVVGICSGFLADALGCSGSVAFSALLYLIAAALLGILAQKMLPRFLSWLLLLLPMLAFRAVFTCLSLIASIHALPSATFLLHTLIPELLMTALFCIPIYPITKLCVIPISSKSRFSF